MRRLLPRSPRPARETSRPGRGIKPPVTPLARGAVATLVVAAAGRFATPMVWVLAMIAGLSFHDLGRREHAEGESKDWTGWGMQIGFLLVLCGASFDNRNWDRLADLGWSEAAGFVLIGAGVWLRRRTSEAMGRHFTVRVQSSGDHALVQSGPFRILRHPSYASLGLIALGTALSTRSSTALLAAVFVWLPAAGVRIAREEAFLAERFGDAYTEYARRTWRLVPGVF